jgi:hypothetical protein
MVFNSETALLAMVLLCAAYVAGEMKGLARWLWVAAFVVLGIVWLAYQRPDAAVGMAVFYGL